MDLNRKNINQENIEWFIKWSNSNHLHSCLHAFLIDFIAKNSDFLDYVRQDSEKAGEVLKWIDEIIPSELLSEWFHRSTKMLGNKTPAQILSGGHFDTLTYYLRELTLE